MKKLILTIALMCSSLFMSCGNPTSKVEISNDSDSIEQVDTTISDSAVVDSTVCLD